MMQNFIQKCVDLTRNAPSEMYIYQVANIKDAKA